MAADRDVRVIGDRDEALTTARNRSRRSDFPDRWAAGLGSPPPPSPEGGNVFIDHPRARTRVQRVAVVAAAAAATLGACGGGTDAGEVTDAPSDSVAGAEAEPTVADVPPRDAPLAPINNPEIDDPSANGTMSAAMQPGDWFRFEYGYWARIESVRAARPGEVETEATGGGASIINVQVHYDGDEPTSDYGSFQLDTDMYNEALCTDRGAGYFDVLMNKGDTVDVPFCVHLEPGGYNAVTLFSYPGSRQSWGAIYALVAPEGVIEPAPSEAGDSDTPGF